MNITEVTRRDIIDYLITNGISFSGRLEELEFLGRIWDLHSMPSTDSRFDDGYRDIWQHRINNNDWDDHYFLGTYLKLFKCADEIFLKFLETCLHPIVRPSEKEASELVSVFNELLARDGYVLRGVSSISARAVYKGMRLKEGVHGNVKDLIFAANGQKQHSLMKDSSAMVDFKSNRTKAFISYSHKDSRYLTELKIHLGYFTRNGRIDFWDDTKITPGSKWREEIRAAIESAKVAVLLVSADFLNSEFIAKNELPPLLAAAEHEGATILPVIIRPCVFTSTNLNQFQAVNNPSEPLSKMKKYRREEEWTKIAKLVEAALNAQETGIVPSNQIILLHTTEPVEKSLTDVSVQQIRQVLAICARRAIFANQHSEISFRAMLDSLTDCRVELQKMVVFIAPERVQRLVVGIINDLDYIERENKKFSPGLFDRIDEAKLRIIQKLKELGQEVGIPYTLPTTLITDYGYPEADMGV